MTAAKLDLSCCLVYFYKFLELRSSSYFQILYHIALSTTYSNSAECITFFFMFGSVESGIRGSQDDERLVIFSKEKELNKELYLHAWVFSIVRIMKIISSSPWLEVRLMI